MVGITLLAIVATFIVFAYIVTRVDGLAFFAPNSTRGIARSAADFCAKGCRLVDNRCPMTGSQERALNCPLWKYVEADVPTALYGSPFATQ